MVDFDLFLHEHPLVSQGDASVGGELLAIKVRNGLSVAIGVAQTH